MARKKPDGRKLNDGRPKIKQEDLPRIMQMAQEGYCWGAIGKMYGVSGTTAARRVRDFNRSRGMV